MRCCVAESSRREEIREIHKTYSWFYPLIVGSLALLAGIWIGIRIGHWEFVDKDRDDYYMNLWTEGIGVLASAGITVLIIDRFNGMRFRREQKRRLARAVGSRSRDVAMSAIEELDYYGWLAGEVGALKKANLYKAELRDARLNGVNLEGAYLRQANLSGVELGNANLKDANLVFAKAQRAVLNEANLEHASLNSADLEDAYLEYAQLNSATLSHAKLRSAHLDHASFMYARMSNVDLSHSFTSRTNFFQANMHKTKFQSVTDLNSNNFEGATLTCVDLAGRDLADGHLKDADIRMADLRNSNLIGANLKGANLYGALLEGADIWPYDGMARLHHGIGEDGVGSEYTEFWQRGTQLSDAVLPDGTKFTDGMTYDAIAKFTDREHSEFELTLAAINAIRDAETDRIDWEMMLSVLDGL